MTDLGNFKIVIGFTDEDDDISFEYQESDDATRYVMRPGVEEKAALSWQLYHTDFVGKWLDRWYQTVTNRHCVLVSHEQIAIDLNFPELEERQGDIDYVSPNHFSEFEYSPSPYQLVYPWYRSFQEITDDVTLYDGLTESSDLPPYQPLPILTSVRLMLTFSMPPYQNSKTDDAGFPPGFMCGSIQMGTLMEDEATATSVLGKYNRVCRISLMPMSQQGHWMPETKKIKP